MQQSAAQRWLEESQIETIKTERTVPALAIQKPGETGVRYANPNYIPGEELSYQTMMPEIIINTQRTHHKMSPDGQSTQYGWIPVQTDYDVADGNTVHRNYITGMYEMISPTGEILATSPDENVVHDKGLWSVYHTGRNRDMTQAKDSFAN